MDDLGTVLLVVSAGDPLGLEGGKGREGGTTAPDGVVSILLGNNLDHVLLWAHSVQLGLKSIWEVLIEGGSSGKDHVLVKVFPNINIAILDRGEGHLVHTEGLVSLLDEAWVEEGLWGHESWSVDVH